MLAPAAAARADTLVRVEVENAAAPRVAILEPADGARLVAGRPIRVVAESRDADRIWIAVDGRREWSGPGGRLEGEWRPAAGAHEIAAVAERSGSPPALAGVQVTATPPASPASPTSPAPPTSPTSPGPASPVSPGPSASAPSAGSAPFPAGPAPRPLRPTAGARPPASPGRDAAPRAGGAEGIRRTGRAPALEPADPRAPARGARRETGLTTTEVVARAVALPLLLLLTAGAYLLLQRYIDGGAKLAWRGRGRPHDVVVEF